MMILLEKRSGLAVNPGDVSSMSIHKSNGYSVLEVRMISGEKYRLGIRRTAPMGMMYTPSTSSYWR